LFTYVLKKFFTWGNLCENKEATLAMMERNWTMLNDILNAARRSRATLLEDLLGAIALTVLLVGSLFLPVLT
tara:strand:- start:120741 stop:120956 length:216 start_codon:yes stop_codon:yes gene_type:complete